MHLDLRRVESPEEHLDRHNGDEQAAMERARLSLPILYVVLRILALYLVFAPTGEMVSYVEVWATAKPPVHPWMWGRVDPDYEEKGIGTWLLGWAEQRAMRVLTDLPAELRFAPRVGTYRESSRRRNPP